MPPGVPQPDMPKIQNVVSTVNMCCELDLKKIALKARNAEYNPKRFAAVIMRIREPKTTALIFSSGYSCTLHTAEFFALEPYGFLYWCVALLALGCCELVSRLGGL